MDEGCPLTAAPPDLERGAAPLGPPAPAQPTAVPVPGCTHLEGGLFSAPGCLWAVALAAVPGRLLLPAGRQPHRLQAPFSLGVVPHPLLLRALEPWPPPPPLLLRQRAPHPGPACLLLASCRPSVLLAFSLCLSVLSPPVLLPPGREAPPSQRQPGQPAGCGPCPGQAQACGHIGERGSVCWAFRR